jgi:outer membrane protein assembly factor BamB
MIVRRILSLLVVVLAAATVLGAPALAQLPTLPPLGPPGGGPPGSGQEEQEEDPPSEGGGSSSPSRPPSEGSSPPPPPPPGPISPAPGSVSIGVNVAQTGFFDDEDLVPPLAQRWSVPGGGHLLAAEGKVYVAGRLLTALDQATGRTLWTAELPKDSVEGAAYDDGVVFVSTFDDLTAIDARTGLRKWSRNLTSVAFAAPPVASGGVVYVTYGQGGGTALAFRGSDGELLWATGAPGGAATPALDGDRLYLTGACGNAQARDRQTGRAIWTHSTGCSGGGDYTPALFGGRLWGPTEEYRTSGGYGDAPIFAASSGEILARFPGGRPVFADGLAILPAGEGVTAYDGLNGRQVWTRKPGLGTLLAVGHDVFGFREGRLTAINAAEGVELWREPGAGGDALDSSSVTRLAVAPGLLIVARNGRVSAWSSVLRPAPRAVDTYAEPSDITSDASTSLVGVAGRELRTPGQQVVVEGAIGRGRFGRISSLPLSPDGGFSAGVRLRRNARLRAIVGGVPSAPVRVYVEPQVTIGKPRAASRRLLRVNVSVKAVGARLAGRRFVLYLARDKARRLDRVATGRLRRSGKHRTRATLVFAPLRRVGKKDVLTFCIPGQAKLGLGRPSALNRRCGTRRIRG